MKDHFTSLARQYASFRPTYPPELYAFIYKFVQRFERAWDAGTGNGQVARDLSPRFARINATDISKGQLDQAPLRSNIEYSLAAETTTFDTESIDLITVAQAIHWFNIPKFYNEVRRVGRRDGILAVWGYSLLRIAPGLDSMIDSYYKDVVGPFWDPERRLIDEHYRTIPFPFEEIASPPFELVFEWTIGEMEGYLTTWSAVLKYKKEKNSDPVPGLVAKLRPLWGAPTQTVRFPLFLRIGKINSRHSLT